MPATRTLSDLSNHGEELSKLCHDSEEPIFLTRNGERDMVLMSVTAYERLEARLSLYHRLHEAEVDVATGDRGLSVAAIRRTLRR